MQRFSANCHIPKDTKTSRIYDSGCVQERMRLCVCAWVFSMGKICWLRKEEKVTAVLNGILGTIEGRDQAQVTVLTASHIPSPCSCADSEKSPEKHACPYVMNNSVRATLIHFHSTGRWESARHVLGTVEILGNSISNYGPHLHRAHHLANKGHFWYISITLAVTASYLNTEQSSIRRFLVLIDFNLFIYCLLYY